MLALDEQFSGVFKPTSLLCTLLDHLTSAGIMSVLQTDSPYHPVHLLVIIQLSYIVLSPMKQGIYVLCFFKHTFQHLFLCVTVSSLIGLSECLVCGDSLYFIPCHMCTSITPNFHAVMGLLFCSMCCVTTNVSARGCSIALHVIMYATYSLSFSAWSPMIYYQFTTHNQQNAQCSSLDICVICKQ